MGPARDRRKGPGRRRTDWTRDAYDPVAVRGLLHDVGHQMTTMSCLVEAVRGEAELQGEARRRMEILAQEMSRLLDIIAHGLSGELSEVASAVDLSSLACRVVQLVQIRHPASVVLLPGPNVTLEADPALLWRVLTNVVENAARAAGPRGRVEIRLRGGHGAAIDVIDDGPGFDRGAPGTASLGLSVVTSLVESCGGSLEFRSPPAGGTQISIRLPPACSGQGDERAGAPP
ncbi:MAG: hypothetical protein C5B60_06015 [Chloroflexi bacterium]|nr:MAG: hypothetical protein C5B60_06015 [Chloroflexota bacterium]